MLVNAMTSLLDFQWALMMSSDEIAIAPTRVSQKGIVKHWGILSEA